MKKIIFSVITFVIVVTCMVACSNTSSDLPAFTEPTEPVVELEIPVLSEEFIKNALQFVKEYPSGKNLENLALFTIEESDGFKDKLYAYLNYYLTENFGEEIYQFFGYGCDTVDTVKVFIHNYKVGGHVGCVAFNSQTDPFFNYNHDKIILAASVLGKKYPDNVKLAEARIASYVLAHMKQDDVSCCIVTNPEGKKSYDFTFKNEAFRETAEGILRNLSKS